MRLLALLAASLILLGTASGRADARPRRKPAKKKPAAAVQAEPGSRAADAGGPVEPEARTPAEPAEPAASPAPAPRTPQASEEEPSEEPKAPAKPARKAKKAAKPPRKRAALQRPSFSEPARAQEPQAGRAAVETKAERPEAAPAGGDGRDLASAAGFSLLRGMGVGAVLDGTPAEDFRLSDAIFFLDAKGAVKARHPILDTSLKPGDRVLYVNGRRIEGVDDMAQALRGWVPGTRLGAVILRSGILQTLSTRLADPEPAKSRDAASLTLLESRLRDAYLVEAGDPKRAEPLRVASFQVPAGERLWLRFPKGIPKTARQGDILEAETTTPMATDTDLDFLALPQGSRLWAQVVSAREDGAVQQLRLHFYKIRPAGGKTYAFSALLKDVVGERLTRVSEGGTLVGVSAEEGPYLAGPDAYFEARMLKSLVLYEPESYYLAGPGLWLKQLDRPRSEGLEITHVIPQRSADNAGLKAGDVLVSINGGMCSNMSFSQGIGALYGPGGSTVQLRVRRAGRSRAEAVPLVRGVRYQKGLGIRAKAAAGGLTVTRVFPGSPADRAGLKEGDRLVKAGAQELASLGREELTKVLADSLAGDKVLTYEPAGDKNPRKASVAQGVYPVALAPATELRDVQLIEDRAP